MNVRHTLSVLLAATVLHPRSCLGQVCDVTVTTVNFAFSPSTIDVNVGQTVCFVPENIHNVVQTPGPLSTCTPFPTPNSSEFGSTTLGQRVEYNFTRVGSFFFVCTPHCSSNSMTGVVNVASGVGPPTAQPTASTGQPTLQPTLSTIQPTGPTVQPTASTVQPTAPTAPTAQPTAIPTFMPTSTPSATPTRPFVCDINTVLAAATSGVSVWTTCDNLAQCCCEGANRALVAVQLNCTIPLGQPCPTGCCDDNISPNPGCTTGTPTTASPTTRGPTLSPTLPPTVQQCASICCTTPSASTRLTLNSTGGAFCTDRCNPNSANTLCTNRATAAASLFCASEATCCNAHPVLVLQLCGVHGCLVNSCPETRCPAHCRATGCFYNATSPFGGNGGYMCIDQVDITADPLIATGSLLLDGEQDASATAYRQCPKLPGVFACTGYSDECMCTDCDVGSGPCKFVFGGTNQTICQTRSSTTNVCTAPYTTDCCRTTTTTPTASPTASPSRAPTFVPCTGCAYGSTGECMYRLTNTDGFCLPAVQGFGCLPSLELCATFQGVSNTPAPTAQHLCTDCSVPGVAPGSTGTFGDCHQQFDGGNITFCMPFLRPRSQCLPGMQSCAVTSAPSAAWVPNREIFELRFSTPTVFSTVLDPVHHLAVWNGNFSTVNECQQACAESYADCRGVYEYFDEGSSPQQYRCILLSDLGDLALPGSSLNVSSSFVKLGFTSTTGTTSTTSASITTTSSSTMTTTTTATNTVTEARSYSYREVFRSTGVTGMYGARFSTAHNATARLFVTGVGTFGVIRGLCELQCDAVFNHQCAGIYMWANSTLALASPPLYRCAGLGELGAAARNTLVPSFSYRRERDCRRCGLHSGPCMHVASRLCMEYAAHPFASVQECLPNFSECDVRGI